ncbi:MAG: DUF1330 domain-containing protein [Alphaproteobacteria bacterium]|nr:DUF1330 domain-containing protein [Alphaproteobacteria bacterium]MCB9928354.1 DUF1330 domain-containing protein [Alphaproteobacteria bacterium]
MPAYVIARVNVTDPDQYAKYRAVTPGCIAAFGGEFVVRGGAMETLEGPQEDRRMVVIRFDSMEKARAFYESEAYQAAIQLRQPASEAQLVLLEGCAD